MPSTESPSSQVRLLGMGKGYEADLVSMMGEVELLTDLNGRELERLAFYLKAFEADAGGVIFREGDPGHYLCMLVSGRVGIYKHAAGERALEVASEGRGRSIGEMALIDGEPRSATCVAAVPTVLLLLTAEGYQRLSEEQPALALKLLKRMARLISRRLRRTSGQLVDYLGN